MNAFFRGLIFPVCIGAINLASSIGIPAKGDVVTDWNSAALDAIRAGAAPPIASRSLAIRHVSIYDAVNGIARTHLYLVQSAVSGSASREAAASAAGARGARNFTSRCCIQLRCALRRDSRWHPRWAAKDRRHRVG
jgi:hypothetical protein